MAKMKKTGLMDGAGSEDDYKYDLRAKRKATQASTDYPLHYASKRELQYRIGGHLVMRGKR